VSTATPVPETWELTGDDARRVLASVGRRHLLRDAFLRLRVADGFSHARSLAYATSLVFVQAIIALVGLAVALGHGSFSRVVVRSLTAAVPGPGGTLLTNAVTQAHRAGVSHRYAGLVFGLLGTLITGSTLVGQIERGLNRIYGIEQDRPTLHKYGRAFLITVTAGTLALLAFSLLAFGETMGDSIHNGAANRAWGIARWPAAVILVTFAITVVFRSCPRRHQPSLSWLAFGASIAAIGWVVATAGLRLFFSMSTSFGETYGQLAGMVALLLWSLLSSIAVLYGGAVAAQLEAVRAGDGAPRDVEKVEHSEPESRDDAVLSGITS
jgi:YihY family inner membrane protein